jgi:hypothetical protein
MRNLVAYFFVALVCLNANASEILTMEAAVKIAEKFVAENGYTNLAESRVKQVFDRESIEWSAAHQDQAAERFNTLQPRAIGAKSGRKNGSAGWSVAFDYTSSDGDRTSCRVVTMASNGNEIRVEHVDGERKFFVGFGKNGKR